MIVPAWNEASNVGNTIREIVEHIGDIDYAVAVVDDGSDDDTAAVARGAGAIVLPLPFNMGVGGAMRAGYTYAKQHGFHQAIQVDADGQHDPRDIRTVLDGLNDADISIGARFADVGEYTVRGPRKWAIRLLAAVLSKMAGTPLTDVTSGFRAANARTIEQYVRYYPAEYLGDTVDSLVAALHSGLIVTQVAVAMRPRVHGRPSQNAFDSSIYLLRTVFALLLAVMRSRGVREQIK